MFSLFFAPIQPPALPRPQRRLPSPQRLLLRFAAAIAGIVCLTSAHALPSFQQVRQDFASSESLLLDRQGVVIHRLRTNPQVRRGQWVALADISPALRVAMVLSEDKRFYEHSGVDWRAAGAAAWGNLWNKRTRGASTLTMQLVGLVDEDLQRSQGRRTLLQKFGQAAAAQMLDAKWQKDEILEAYLNLVPYRGELVGIDALSHTLFAKAAHGMDEREAAIAAALVRAPNASPKAVAQRACGVLAQMQKTRPTPLLCDTLSLFATGVMQRKAWSPSDGIAPHMAQRLLASSSNTSSNQSTNKAGNKAASSTSKTPASPQPQARVIRSTLSAPLQRFATEQLQQTMHELAGRNVRDGAVLVLDNATGDVLAWVGAAPTTSSAPQVDYVTAQRQPGSTLKPFLYAQAIAERRLTAASLLDDSSAAIATQNGLYVPQDYDRKFRGWVSVRLALASSLNVPAVRTIGMVGVNRFAAQLQKMGIALPHTGDFYGHSLALGSPEMSLLQLANAYRTLANAGQFSPVRMTLPEPANPASATGTTSPTAPKTAAKATATTQTTAPPATAPKQVLDARASYIIGHILSDNNARIATFGNNSILHTRFWSAVKTGTSKDMRDNWAIGYSQHYTVAVWVGNARGQAMWDVSGTSGAAPVWAAIMQHLHSSTPSQPPTPPAGMVQTTVQFASPNTNNSSKTAPRAGIISSLVANEPSRKEWFISGTEQTQFLPPDSQNSRTNSAHAHIQTPTNGTIVAIDPDIPPKHQRLLLRTDQPRVRWQINGKPAGSGSSVYWMPWPGKHQISLHNLSGKTLDTIQIEVRGAGVKDAAAVNASTVKQGKRSTSKTQRKKPD